MEKLFNPVNAQLPSQSGGVKWALLSILVVAAFALTWFYPEIKNTLSAAWHSDKTAVTDEAAPKANNSKSAGGGKPSKGGKEGKGGGEGSRSTPVSVGEVRLMDIRYSVQAAGTLVALNTAVVRAKVDGELKALRFTEGQLVQAGQVLAEIDARPFEAQLNQAQGQFARDAALLKNAELDLQRYQDLLSKDAIARQQVETQAALVRQLQGTVQADQAQIDMAKLQLSYT
ncbi:MAG: biotin/lipoyl-binding protein, partial [Betaproteobacteria bacterium]|nr:biotin/lipoyl-binding protein [Betaproteobacteria bacterium]